MRKRCGYVEDVQGETERETEGTNWKVGEKRDKERKANERSRICVEMRESARDKQERATGKTGGEVDGDIGGRG